MMTALYFVHNSWLFSPWPFLSHTPPGTSDEHMTVVKGLMNSRPEGAIIVTTPQEVALATIRKEIDFCRKMNLNIIGIVENMNDFTCPCCRVQLCMFSLVLCVSCLAKHVFNISITFPWMLVNVVEHKQLEQKCCCYVCVCVCVCVWNAWM